MSTVLITGSNGLIGSELVAHFDGRGWRVVGVDNNMRAEFFGPAGDTRWNQKRLERPAETSRIASSISEIVMAFGF